MAGGRNTRRAGARHPRPKQPGARQPQGSDAARRFVAAGLLAVCVIAAYAPAIGGDFLWDDDRYVSNNPLLENAKGLWRIWTDVGSTVQYYPLTFTSFWLDHHIFGPETAGYHLVNLGLHLLTCLLLYGVLRRLDCPGSAIAAAVFALHPVHVESVAWITERKNVLSGCFALAATLKFVRYCGLGGQGHAPRAASDYVLALVLFAAGLLSKSAICTLPAAWLLILYWKRGSVSVRRWSSLVPFFALGLGMAAVTAWFEQAHVGADVLNATMPWLDRLMLAGRAWFFYAGKLIWPFDLSFVYTRWTQGGAPWMQLAYPIGAGLIIALLWIFRSRIGRGPACAMLIHAVLLFPVLGFFQFYYQRYSFVADHFQYLASIPLIALLTAGGVRLFAMLTSRAARPAAGRAGLSYVPVVAVCGGLALLTYSRAHVFNNLESLWRDTLSKNGSCALAYNNLGAILESRHDLEGARQCYERAVENDPAFYQAYLNLGLVHKGAGQFAQARSAIEHALELNPEHSRARINLALVLAESGVPEQAIHNLEQVKAGDPLYAKARYNLGLICHQQKDIERAAQYYAEAIEADPAYASAYFNLGNAYLALGRMDDALHNWRQAIAHQPNWAQAHFNVGTALADRGKLREARQHLATAVRLKPDYVAAQLKLGMLCHAMGDDPSAAEALRQVLRLEPSNSVARQLLARLEN